jgi:prevent-host-death family protein
MADSQSANLVSSITRSGKPTAAAKTRRRPLARRVGYWLLQDAKARFSELVRRVKSEGPQHVTVHGLEEVVVIAADDFRRLQGERTGKALIVAMQASPYRDVEIEPTRTRLPVRDVAL